MSSWLLGIHGALSYPGLSFLRLSGASPATALVEVKAQAVD